MAFFSNLKISNCGQKGRIVVASRAFVYTNAILLCKNACWAVPKPHLFCIVPMQAARFFKTLLFVYGRVSRQLRSAILMETSQAKRTAGNGLNGK